jgi:hypothetical protein
LHCLWTPSLFFNGDSMAEETLEKCSEGRGSLKHIDLSIERGMASAFTELLQNGFLFECHVGVSVKSLLCEELGLSEQYVTERISTVFLDGSCVDDIDSATVREGSFIALSAAMPGLAGASLRRGGVYGAMRSSITYKENDRRGEKTGLCSIKLFNLLIGELGPIFLQRGILVKADDLEVFLKKKSEEFWRRCRQILLEGKPADRDFVLEFCRHGQADFLRLTATVEA